MSSIAVDSSQIDSNTLKKVKSVTDVRKAAAAMAASTSRSGNVNNNGRAQVQKPNGTTPEAARGGIDRKRTAVSGSGGDRPVAGVMKRPKMVDKKDPLMLIDSILSDMDNFEQQKKKAKKKEEEETEDEAANKKSGGTSKTSAAPVAGVFKVPTFTDLTRMENDNSIVFSFLERNPPGVNEMVLAYKMLRGRVDPFNYGYYERTRLKPANLQVVQEKTNIADIITAPVVDDVKEEPQNDSPGFDLVPDEDQSLASQAARRNQVKAYVAKHICKSLSEVETFMSEEHWQLMGKMKPAAVFKYIDMMMANACKAPEMASPDGNSDRNSVAMDISSDEGSVILKSESTPVKRQQTALEAATSILAQQPPPSTSSIFPFAQPVAPQYFPIAPAPSMYCQQAAPSNVPATDYLSVMSNYPSSVQGSVTSAITTHQHSVQPNYGYHSHHPPPSFQVPSAPASQISSHQSYQPPPVQAVAQPPPTITRLPSVNQNQMNQPGPGPSQSYHRPPPQMTPQQPPVFHAPPPPVSAVHKTTPFPSPRHASQTTPPRQGTPFPSPRHASQTNFQQQVNTPTSQTTRPPAPQMHQRAAPQMRPPTPQIPPQNSFNKNGQKQHQKGRKNNKNNRRMSQNDNNQKQNQAVPHLPPPQPKQEQQKPSPQINMNIIRSMPPPPIPKILQDQRQHDLQQQQQQNPPAQPAQPPQQNQTQTTPNFQMPRFPPPPQPAQYQPRPSGPGAPDSGGVMRALFSALKPGTGTSTSEGQPPQQQIQQPLPRFNTPGPRPNPGSGGRFPRPQGAPNGFRQNRPNHHRFPARHPKNPKHRF